MNQIGFILTLKFMQLSEESKAMIMWLIISIAILTFIIMVCIRFYDHIARLFLCCTRQRDQVEPAHTEP